MTDIARGFATIQQEAFQFNQPVSEAAGSSLGSSVNGLLSVLIPLGGSIMSVLNETQFQAQLGNPSPPTFVLADGRNIVGSALQILTGNTTIPDLRGTYPRGSDNGGSAAGARGLDPNGTQTPGTYIGDSFQQHVHQYQAPNGGSGGGSASGTSGQAPFTNTTGATSGNPGTETAPKTTYMNFFIRIN